MGPLNAANLKKQQKGGKKAAKGKGGKGGGGGGSGEQPQGNSAIDTNKREYIFQVGARRMNELLLLFFIGGGGGFRATFDLPTNLSIPPYPLHATRQQMYKVSASSMDTDIYVAYSTDLS